MSVRDVKQVTLCIENTHVSYAKSAKLDFHDDVEWERMCALALTVQFLTVLKSYVF